MSQSAGNGWVGGGSAFGLLKVLVVPLKQELFDGLEIVFRFCVPWSQCSLFGLEDELESSFFCGFVCRS